MSLETFALRLEGDRLSIGLFPATPSGPGPFEEVASCDDRCSGMWLMYMAARLAEHPVESCLANGETVTLPDEIGKRVALAFVGCALHSWEKIRYEGNLLAMPDEAVPYWYALCYYGPRVGAGRMGLTALLVYDEG